MWFCKARIENEIPDHSVFCRVRHERFRESDASHRMFEAWQRRACHRHGQAEHSLRKSGVSLLTNCAMVSRCHN